MSGISCHKHQAQHPHNQISSLFQLESPTFLRVHISSNHCMSGLKFGHVAQLFLHKIWIQLKTKSKSLCHYYWKNPTILTAYPCKVWLLFPNSWGKSINKYHEVENPWIYIPGSHQKRSRHLQVLYIMRRENSDYKSLETSANNTWSDATSRRN